MLFSDHCLSSYSSRCFSAQIRSLSSSEPWLHSLTLNKLLTSPQEPLSVLTIRDSLQLSVSWPDINSQELLIPPHVLIFPACCVIIKMCFAVMGVIIKSLMMWARIDFLPISRRICSNQPVLMDYRQKGRVWQLGDHRPGVWPRLATRSANGQRRQSLLYSDSGSE